MRQKVVQMQCLLRPTRALLSRNEVMYPEGGMPKSREVRGIFDDIVKVDAFADMLTRAIKACQTKDGRIDPTDVGAFVARCMIREGGALGPSLQLVGAAPSDEDVAVETVAPALGRLITKGIEKTQARDGLTDTRKVAVFVLRSMKEARL
jgi:hypothetical protein